MKTIKNIYYIFVVIIYELFRIYIFPFIFIIYLLLI